jgi:SAM-dependent methyltransferase
MECSDEAPKSQSWEVGARASPGPQNREHPTNELCPNRFCLTGVCRLGQVFLARLLVVQLPWPWPDSSCEQILGLDVFEHLHLMPAEWLGECHRLLTPGGILKLRVPIFGSPWHLIDPTHVRGFHPLNFDYFIRGRELHQKYGHYYFDFAFRDGSVAIEDYNIIATLTR